MNLKKFRVVLAERGLNQIKLALAIGLSPSALSYYVNGYYQPSLEIQDKIASYLKLQREELFPETESERAMSA